MILRLLISTAAAARWLRGLRGGSGQTASTATPRPPPRPSLHRDGVQIDTAADSLRPANYVFMSRTRSSGTTFNIATVGNRDGKSDCSRPAPQWSFSLRDAKPAPTDCVRRGPPQARGMQAR